MPIYEFYSPDTNRIYSFFARSISQANLVPRCPDDPKARMEKLVSRFAVTSGMGEPDNGEAAEAKEMERVISEVQREMRSIGDSTPDPRQLGKLMRKMSEASGQAMPEAMEKMIQGLERGVDPEKLEAEFGDALEGVEVSPELAELKKNAVPHKPAPRRDTNLYEMRDYL